MSTLGQAVLGSALAAALTVVAGCGSGTSSPGGGASTGGSAPDASISTGGASSGGSGGSGGSSGSSTGGSSGSSTGGAGGGVGGTGGSGGSTLADCNGDGTPETQLGTNTNCSKCGEKCDMPRGTGRCSAGKCETASCDQGSGDCDGDFSNGCETDLNNQHNCGKCGVDCGDADGGVSCVNGACQITKCPSGFDDCNNDPKDGCETPLNTVGDCGACGNPCTVQNGTASCATGVCQVACKTVCKVGDIGCNPGDCVESTCAAGYGDCDGDPKNGCERNTDTSLGDCGKCGNPCNFAHASETCAAGVCTFGACDPGWADCTGGTANGCETDLSGAPDQANTNNILHCGQCATNCSYVNASALCVASGAAFVCQQNGCTSGHYTTSDTSGTCGCLLATPAVTDSAVSCTSAPAVAIPDDGATHTFSANEPDLQSDWYHFNFPSANTKADREYRGIQIHVTDSFRLEVKDASCALGSTRNCTGPGDPNDPTSVQTWDWTDPCNVATAAGANSSNECTNLINGTGYKSAPDDVWVRVFSTSSTASCVNYVLTVTRRPLPLP